MKRHQRNINGFAAIRHSSDAKAEPVAEAGIGRDVGPYSGVSVSAHAVVESGALLVLKFERDHPSRHPTAQHCA